MTSLPQVLIIVGPTGSGKTSLSEELCTSYFSGEVINADAAQLYKPLSIGTAKPNWQSYSFPAYLFDSVETPKNVDAKHFVCQSLNIIKDIHQRSHVPIIVGGTFFYIKSLFFVLANSSKKINFHDLPNFTSSDKAWEFLKKIDPVRALELHPNDRYRIDRALELWSTTGRLPSSMKPIFSPQVNPLFVWIQPERSVLKKRIELRTEEMLKQGGWIEEAFDCMDTEWEKFITQKGFIGYDVLFKWIREGKKDSLEYIGKIIKAQTWQYAKRQIAFWRRFVEQLEEEEQRYRFITVESLSSKTSSYIAQAWKDFSNKN